MADLRTRRGPHCDQGPVDPCPKMSLYAYEHFYQIRKEKKGRRNDKRKNRQEIEGLEGIVEVLQSSEQPH
ncbi:hypothetical protein TNCV_3021401 [Trichonephila clavipes]|nr:hypothetical protein TNCV_3021401 [Trichonephila clavipes]